MDCEQVEMRELTRQILKALEFGPIRNLGGMVYSSQMNFLCVVPSDLIPVIKEAASLGIIIARTDSGGTPTWDIERIDSC